MITSNNILKITIIGIAIISTSVVCSESPGDEIDDYFKSRFKERKSITKQAEKVQDSYLSIHIKVARTCEYDEKDKSCSIASVRIKNISKFPVALMCDPSPRSLTYLRIEGMGFLASGARGIELVNTREIIFDVGKFLSNTNDLSLYILQPEKVIEVDIDISPLLYSDLFEGDAFAIRAELRSSPNCWQNQSKDLAPGVGFWADRAIISDQSIISVISG